MFKDIEGIRYDNGDPGRAFGGGIYGASCTVGFANASTKITLSVVAESSDDYTISEDDLDVTDSGEHTIQVGSVKFHRMYLYSYNFSNTPSSKTLTVNFVDQSMCLDKIFVGLATRHGTMTNQIINEGQWYNPSNTVQVTAISETFWFRILCLECNSLRPSKLMHPPSDEEPHYVTRMVYISGDGTGGPVPFGTYVNVETGQACINGGYILLGKEGFTETNCEIPKVEYTFDDLCNALDYILGGDPLGHNGDPVYKHNLRDFKRSSTYAASYTGTLREVLSAWAADFSFDFTFDYSQEDLWVQGIDLDKAVDLTDVKNAIQGGFGPDSKDLANDKKGALIRNHTETHTLENTYKQSPVVKFIKPPRPFQRTQKNYQQAVGKIVTPRDAIGESAHLGRDDTELNVSMALGKYSSEARIIWLSDLARKKWEEPKAFPGDTGAGAPAGTVTTPDGTVLTWPAFGPQPVWDNPLHDPTAVPPKIDPAYDPTIHKWPTELGGGGNPDDIRLRRDVPWMALGFFPALGYNSTIEQLARIKQQYPDIGGNPSPQTKYFAVKYKTDIHKRKATLDHFGGCVGAGKMGQTPSSSNHPIWGNPENYSVYIGIWNEHYQDKVGDFDAELANDFLGKYGYWWGNRSTSDQAASGIFNYGPVDPPPDERQCPKFHFGFEGGQTHAAYYYENDVSTLPDSKIYKGHSYPFDNILRANNGFFGIPMGVTDTDPCTYCPERTIFSVADNAWGTPPEEVEKMLRNKYIVDVDPSVSFGYNDPGVFSDLESYIPCFARVGPYDQRSMEGYFINIIGLNNWEDTIVKPDLMQAGYYPGVAIIPHMDKMIIEVDNPPDPTCWKCVGDPGTPKAGVELQILTEPTLADAQLACDLLFGDPNQPTTAKPCGSVGKTNAKVLEVDYSHWDDCCDASNSAYTTKPWVSGTDTWAASDTLTYNNRCYKFADWEDGGKKAHEIYNSDKDAVDWRYNLYDPDVATHFETANMFFESCETQIFNAMVYQNTQRRAKESIKGDPNECILLCEEDIVDAVCRCESIEEPIHKFSKYTSRLLWIKHMGQKVGIVFPVENNYKGFWVSEQMEKGYYPAKRIVMGEPPLPEELKNANGGRGVMETRIVDMDVTQDLEALEVDEQGKYVEHLVVENTLVNPPVKEVVSLPQFFVFMSAITQSADSTNENIQVRVDGTEFDTLTTFMTPANGLATFNVTMDNDGITTDISFLTRPKKLPKRDVLLQKIGPRAIEGRIPKPGVNVARNDWGMKKGGSA